MNNTHSIVKVRDQKILTTARAVAGGALLLGLLAVWANPAPAQSRPRPNPPAPTPAQHYDLTPPQIYQHTYDPNKHTITIRWKGKNHFDHFLLHFEWKMISGNQVHNMKDDRVIDSPGNDGYWTVTANPGETYTFVVKGGYRGIIGPPTRTAWSRPVVVHATAPKPPAPRAPLNVKVTRPWASKSIMVTWTPGDNRATNFVVQFRSTGYPGLGSSSWSPVSTVKGNVHQLTTTLNPAPRPTQWHYRVVAANTGGTAASAEAVEVTPRASVGQKVAPPSLPIPSK